MLTPAPYKSSFPRDMKLHAGIGSDVAGDRWTAQIVLDEYYPRAVQSSCPAMTFLPHDRCAEM
ncbi:MAG TPA: hypothetical protein VMM54_03440 [Nitrospirota bacterium]|nr:hypothetical protein [Nitrospirota bacterium]